MKRVGVPCGAMAAALAHLAGCGAAPATFGDDDAQAAAEAASPGEDAGSSFRPTEAGSFGRDATTGDATTSVTGTCDLGSAASFATNDDLNLFGQIVYYEDGGALPRGHYRAKYLGGCMKYDFIFNWQVQASLPEAGGGGFWFVGDTSSDRIAFAPGSTMSYAAFDDCVTANLAVPVEDFDFDGGRMGVWLNDNPYTDNIAGGDGGNPRWQLTLVGTCPPNLGPQ